VVSRQHFRTEHIIILRLFPTYTPTICHNRRSIKGGSVYESRPGQGADFARHTISFKPGSCTFARARSPLDHFARQSQGWRTVSTIAAAMKAMVVICPSSHWRCSQDMSRLVAKIRRRRPIITTLRSSPKPVSPRLGPLARPVAKSPYGPYHPGRSAEASGF
jgi:hypothetical protein